MDVQYFRQIGFTEQEIDSMLRKFQRAKKTKGFAIVVGAGATVITQLQVDGVSSYLLGIAFSPVEQPDLFKLNIDNVDIMKDLPGQNFNGAIYQEGYYFVPFPMSQKSTVTLTITNALARTFKGFFIYI